MKTGIKLILCGLFAILAAIVVAILFDWRGYHAWNLFDVVVCAAGGIVLVTGVFVLFTERGG